MRCMVWLPPSAASYCYLYSPPLAHAGRWCCSGSSFLEHSQYPAASNSRNLPDPTDAHMWEWCYSDELLHRRAKLVDDGLLPLVPSSICRTQLRQACRPASPTAADAIVAHHHVVVEHPWQVN